MDTMLRQLCKRDFYRKLHRNKEGWIYFRNNKTNNYIIKDVQYDAPFVIRRINRECDQYINETLCGLKVSQFIDSQRKYYSLINIIKRIVKYGTNSSSVHN